MPFVPIYHVNEMIWYEGRALMINIMFPIDETKRQAQVNSVNLSQVIRNVTVRKMSRKLWRLPNGLQEGRLCRRKKNVF